MLPIITNPASIQIATQSRSSASILTSPGENIDDDEQDLEPVRETQAEIQSIAAQAAASGKTVAQFKDDIWDQRYALLG